MTDSKKAPSAGIRAAALIVRVATILAGVLVFALFVAATVLAFFPEGPVRP